MSENIDDVTGCVHGLVWGCRDCMIDRLTRELDEARKYANHFGRISKMQATSLSNIVDVVQRYQPEGGETPPTNEVALVTWVLEQMHARAAAAEAKVKVLAASATDETEARYALRARIVALEAQLATRGACQCGDDEVCALAGRAQEAEVRADEQAAELHRLLKALTGLVTEIEALIAESHGVAGFHLNGDVAKWDELEPGGRFERLASLADARTAIAALDKKEGR